MSFSPPLNRAVCISDKPQLGQAYLGIDNVNHKLFEQRSWQLKCLVVMGGGGGASTCSLSFHPSLDAPGLCILSVVLQYPAVLQFVLISHASCHHWNPSSYPLYSYLL